jgi:uracil-DNA glycosylase
MEVMQQEIWSRCHTALRQRLESLQRSGVSHVRKPPVTVLADSPVALPPPPAVEPPVVVPRRSSAPERAALSPAAVTAPLQPGSGHASQDEPAKQAALEILQREVAHCMRCAPLASTRTQTVFGVGSSQARLCLVGEAPGADEDRQGEPFVGAAGQLLNKILAACGLKREEVYILNTLKCRPPENRTPQPEEMANCRTFFERQLEIIQPEFICCLGATAARAVLRTTQPLGRLRGRFHDYRGIRVMVTYHPAYLLRTPDKKRETWEDMKMLLREMGLELPSTGGG